ncbi:response regulator [uncultured Methanofollis sp.]|uniref:response regulator n=1 Tax=uncultured Methanofollis sp. TaxID=262500 RepID=UPI002635A390|nr:response regulator [uncultured Methanofollis sp.]
MRHKILVVDDDRPTLEMISLLLLRGGYEPVVSADPVEALDIARLSHPDLVLLDVLMEPIDGWQFLDTLMVDPALSHLPVMLFTACPLVGGEHERYRGHVVRVFQKPVYPPELMKALERFFS